MTIFVKIISKYLYYTIIIATILSCNFKTGMIPGFPIPVVTVEEKTSDEEEAFARAVNFGTPAEIKTFLAAGHSPDHMEFPGAIPWGDTNPLWSVGINYEKITILISYGADVNMRPYIGAFLGSMRLLSERYPTQSAINEYGIHLEKEGFDLIKLFLGTGANPNAKWCSTSPLFPPTEDRYNKYFEENGILPINYAIEKNLFSIVDLLLEYGAVLDRFSLDRAKIATEKSGSTEMEEYVQKIWEQQNQERDAP
jgi:ankyrin repeat protein